LNQFITSIRAIFTAQPAIKKALIAYSGGVDSHVLLHVCAEMLHKNNAIQFQAISINHGLHVESNQWIEHCERVSNKLGVPFIARSVTLKNIKREGVENAARLARYAELAEFVDQDTVLLTAQHQDDQAETLLLQLFRGCGVQGLASMPRLTEFGLGYIARPFLSISQKDILDHAEQQGLHWLEDPSNAELQYDRNYLRHAVIPVIKERWGSFSKTTARTAKHCAEASEILTSFLVEASSAQAVNSLDTLELVKQPEEMQRAILRQWCANNGVKTPSAKVLEQLQHHVVGASDDAMPVLSVSDYEVRRFKQHLYLMPRLPVDFTTSEISWKGEHCVLPAPIGELIKATCVGSGIKAELWKGDVSVRFRRGGERIKLKGRDGTRTLKNLLNELELPFWVRERLPLIYIGDDLAAVADVWVAAKFLANDNEAAFCIKWSHPELSY
jgi:tRNA(Ile)-lysidine synthase